MLPRVDDVGLDPVDDLLHLLRVLVVLAQLGGQGEQEPTRSDVAGRRDRHLALEARIGEVHEGLDPGLRVLVVHERDEGGSLERECVGHVLEARQQQVLVGHEARRQEVLDQVLGDSVGPVVLLHGHDVVGRLGAGLLGGREGGHVRARRLAADVVQLDVDAVGVLDVRLELVDQLVVGRVRPVADGQAALGSDGRRDLLVGHVLVDDRDVLGARLPGHSWPARSRLRGWRPVRPQGWRRPRAPRGPSPSRPHTTCGPCSRCPPRSPSSTPDTGRSVAMPASTGQAATIPLDYAAGLAR